MVELVLRNLTRRFGGHSAAVAGIDLHVRSGEFVTLLGPSGCGKSTTLSMIAGLETPDDGHIDIDGVTLFDAQQGIDIAAERRNIGLVFQSYALWPHMKVRDNIAYGLKLRRVGRAERKARVEEVAALVEMSHLLDRYPSQLSGGQQQRVALARTLAYRPKVLLLDEPFSNLDAKLRDKARMWLRQIQGHVGITTIFVTHDQTEALSLSDRIAVMSNGRIEQVGSPSEVYEAPTVPFVAEFVGTSNFLPATVLGGGAGALRLRLEDGSVIEALSPLACAPGDQVTISSRPERLSLTTDVVDNSIPGRIEERTYTGSRMIYSVRVGNSVLRIESLNAISGADVRVVFPNEKCAVFRLDAAHSQFQGQ